MLEISIKVTPKTLSLFLVQTEPVRSSILFHCVIHKSVTTPSGLRVYSFRQREREGEKAPKWMRLSSYLTFSMDGGSAKNPLRERERERERVQGTWRHISSYQ